jgi:thymidylate synthase
MICQGVESGVHIVTPTAFKVGDRVLKHTGDYQIEGEVRGVLSSKKGAVRYVVEHPGGMLHIYSEGNLTLVTGSSMERQYLDILKRCLAATPRKCRNGTTRAIFAAQIRHDMREGFPLLTTKKVAWKLALSELLWFIEGGKNSPVPYRLDNARFREIAGMAPGANTIWSMDAGKPAWLAKAQFEDDCGRIYGAQWRNWGGKIDQLANLVKLLRTDPFSRYLKMTAWNPTDISDMCLPPCHAEFQCFVEEENGQKYLSLHMNQRSCDMFLGVPFNIAGYGFFLSMLAKVSGMVAKELVITFNDAHVYEAHVEAVQTQLARPLHPLPTLSIEGGASEIDDFWPNHFVINNYTCGETIKAPLL